MVYLLCTCTSRFERLRRFWRFDFLNFEQIARLTAFESPLPHQIKRLILNDLKNLWNSTRFRRRRGTCSPAVRVSRWVVSGTFSMASCSSPASRSSPRPQQPKWTNELHREIECGLFEPDETVPASARRLLHHVGGC
jgi:hypothetical protein